MTAKIKENKGRWKSGTKKLFVSQKRRLCIPFQVCFFFFSLLLFFYLLPRKKKLKRRHTEHRCSTYVHVSDKATAHISLFNSTHTHTHKKKKGTTTARCPRAIKKKKKRNQVTQLWQQRREENIGAFAFAHLSVLPSSPVVFSLVLRSTMVREHSAYCKHPLMRNKRNCCCCCCVCVCVCVCLFVCSFFFFFCFYWLNYFYCCCRANP